MSQFVIQGKPWKASVLSRWSACRWTRLVGGRKRSTTLYNTLCNAVSGWGDSLLSMWSSWRIVDSFARAKNPYCTSGLQKFPLVVSRLLKASDKVGDFQDFNRYCSKRSNLATGTWSGFPKPSWSPRRNPWQFMRNFSKSPIGAWFWTHESFNTWIHKTAKAISSKLFTQTFRFETKS